MKYLIEFMTIFLISLFLYGTLPANISITANIIVITLMIISYFIFLLIVEYKKSKLGVCIIKLNMFEYLIFLHFLKGCFILANVENLDLILEYLEIGYILYLILLLSYVIHIWRFKKWEQ